MGEGSAVRRDPGNFSRGRVLFGPSGGGGKGLVSRGGNKERIFFGGQKLTNFVEKPRVFFIFLGLAKFSAAAGGVSGKKYRRRGSPILTFVTPPLPTYVPSLLALCLFVLRCYSSTASTLKKNLILFEYFWASTLNGFSSHGFQGFKAALQQRAFSHLCLWKLKGNVHQNRQNPGLIPMGLSYPDLNRGYLVLY